MYRGLRDQPRVRTGWVHALECSGYVVASIVTDSVRKRDDHLGHGGLFHIKVFKIVNKEFGFDMRAGPGLTDFHISCTLVNQALSV